MITQAEKKFRQPEIHLIRADILACRFDHPFDRCLVLNTLPHFTNPDPLLRRLAGCVRPGGRITLGQCMGEGAELCRACPGFSPLPETTRLARMMAPWFLVDIQISDTEKYVVSGLRNDLPVCIPAARQSGGRQSHGRVRRPAVGKFVFRKLSPPPLCFSSIHGIMQKIEHTIVILPTLEERTMDFDLHAPYTPTGDQPQAIEKLVQGLRLGLEEQTLLGVTGSGKTFTMANVIAQLNRPTLVLAHNKTLAAQLCSEFREFFPQQCRGVLHQLLRLLPAGGLHCPN